ncbi:MAG: response regulator [Planctomycetota bacterium]
MFQSFRILLVEDDDSLRLCLSEFLASQGWDVAAAGHGVEAIQFVRQRRFDFSILDFHLPGQTGLELFRQLAAMQPLPAILMSGLCTTEEALAARDAGFFSFLRKPLELGALRQSVQNLIRSHFGGPLQHLPSRPPSPPPSSPQPHPRGGARPFG